MNGDLQFFIRGPLAFRCRTHLLVHSYSGLSIANLMPRFAKACWTLLRIYFASCPHLCYYKTRMSALIFMGGLWAVLPGRTAIASNPCERCAVCESCKSFICKVLG